MEFSSYILCLIICFGLSFLIGFERQVRRRFIGLRTTILVAVGSFLYVSFTFLVGDYQMTRIAAQVVSGMGFLGAGVIIKDGFKVRGLTTAATLWCDAAIGVLCAGGYIKEAVAGTVAILFANVILRYINSIVSKNTKNRLINERYLVEIKASKDNIKILKDEITTFIQNNHDYIVLNKTNINNDIVSEIKYDFTVVKIKNKKLEKFISELDNSYDLININYEKMDETEIEEIEDEL